MYGTFSEGNTGRLKGAKDLRTDAIESLLEGQVEALKQKAIGQALEGDSVALRLCLKCIAASPKYTPVSFSLPSMQSANDASQVAGGVLKAVAKGELISIKASRIMGLVDSYRRTLERTDSGDRLRLLEDEVQ